MTSHTSHTARLQSLREGDTLVVWKLDRLGRNLRHLVNTLHWLTAAGVGLCVLAGQGAATDTTTAGGKLTSDIFPALAEFERELIVERTRAGLASTRAWTRWRAEAEDDNDSAEAPACDGRYGTRETNVGVFLGTTRRAGKSLRRNALRKAKYLAKWHLYAYM